MKRIESEKEIIVGMKFVRIMFESFDIFEVLCEHPHNSRYIICLDENQDGTKKMYKQTIIEERCYVFTNSKSDYQELYELMKKRAEKMVRFYSNKISSLLTKEIKQS